MYILLICTIFSAIVLFFISNKKVEKENEFYDEVVSGVVEKIGDNEQIAKEILKFIGNTSTTVEKNEDEKIKASFYNGNNDKITIKDTKDLKECSRIVHIAHECIHSVQDKKIVKASFILSNIQILYFLGIFIYFFYNKNSDTRFALLLVQVFIFIMTFFVKIVLESDASYRGPELAFSYLEDKMGSEELKAFKNSVRNKMCGIIPVFYFSIYMQGAILLMLAQVCALFIA